MNSLKKLLASLFSTSTSTSKPQKRAVNRRSFSGASLAVGGLAFVMVSMAHSALAQNLARFNGGIGVIPTGSANTTVRSVAAAGQIWVIRDLSGDVKQDGNIRIDGRGLLLGAGDS